MHDPNCIFCKISAGEIPAKVVYEDDFCMAFHDVAPVAPTHALIIPKEHYSDIREVKDETVVGRLMGRAVEVAAKLGLDEGGYRIVVNTGADGGQTVFHLHIHVMGSRHMAWPPG